MKLRLFTILMSVAIVQLCAAVSFGQYIIVNPTDQTFATTQGGPLPVAQSFTISNNDGSATLNWSLTDDATWLDEDPTAGVGNYQQVTVSVNTANLLPDIYNASITISSNAVNGPQTVDVTYVVVESGGIAIGDANCDGAINISDAVYLINYIFKSGPAPGCP